VYSIILTARPFLRRRNGKIRNTKDEIRNTKKFELPKIPMTKTKGFDIGHLARREKRGPSIITRMCTFDAKIPFANS
jgi:hypothetical protein